MLCPAVLQQAYPISLVVSSHTVWPYDPTSLHKLTMVLCHHRCSSLDSCQIWMALGHDDEDSYDGAGAYGVASVLGIPS